MITALARLAGFSPLTIEHAELEAEHQQLHSLIEDFFECMRYNDDASQAFKALHQAMFQHFEHEQRLMESSEYRSRQRHISTHNQLLAQLELLFEHYPQGKASIDYVNNQEKAFMKMLNKHIAVSDFMLARHLKQHR